MRIKEMISDQRSFDFSTNSFCYHQTKDIEKIMENMDILMLKHQCTRNNQFGIFYKNNTCFIYFRTGTLSTALTSSTPSTTP